jgi:TolB-like protein/DNA-binding SARP family transcriptional activator
MEVPLHDRVDGAARWSLRLLGGFELAVIPGGHRVQSLGKRERALLAYLALSSDGREQRRKLAALLWEHSGEQAALDSLRTSLWRLRKALGDSQHRIVASEAEDIVLDLAAFDVDAIAFRRLAVHSAREALEAAASLYSAEFLDGFSIDSEEFENWRRAEAMRYRDEIIDVLTRLMMQLGQRGEAKAAIEVGNRILRLEPLHDAVVRRLMQLYGETGRRGAAIEVYRAHDGAMRAELNGKPEPETRGVFADLANKGDWVFAGAENTSQNTEIAAQGVDPVLREGAPPDQDSSVRTNRRTLKWSLLGCLVAGIAIFLLQDFILSRGALTAPKGMSESAATLSSDSDTIAMAVLPFINVSGDAAEDYLSDGISEEVMSALAKLPGLRVVGRSSAFRFKGEGRDLRTIGRSLNAPYLLDASVRIVRGRVHITAQLVHAEDGIRLWTDSYDRELSDISAVQADIVRAIATALRMPLRSQPVDTAVWSRGIDVNTYEDYLRAKAKSRGRIVGGGIQDVVNALEAVVESSPDFAPAWASLAAAYNLVPVYSGALLTGSSNELRQLRKQNAQRAEDAAERAVRLDPNLAEGYVALAFIEGSRRDKTRAFEHIEKALALDPTNPDVLAAYRNILLEVGRIEDSLEVQQRIVALEPFVPRFKVNLATNLWLVGQDAAAIEILTASLPGNDTSAPNRVRLAMMYAAKNRYGDAADTLAAMPERAFSTAAVETAVHLLRTAPSRVSPAALPELGALGFVYLHVGEPSRVLEYYEDSMESGYLGIGPLWHEAYAPVRRTERFKRLVQKARLPEFWRAHGWPVFCHPVGQADFECG